MAIDVDEARVQRSEVSLWLAWTVATAAAMLLGFVPFTLVIADMSVFLARLLVPLWAGFLVGLFQWLALRPYLTRAVDWVLSGGASWALGFALGLAVMEFLRANPLGVVLGYLLFGLIIAVLQWPTLRREIPNAWAWVIASIAGWAAGAWLSQIILAAVSGGEPVSPIVSSAVTAGVTGVVAGAITGLALVWIVRQPERVPGPGAPTTSA